MSYYTVHMTQHSITKRISSSTQYGIQSQSLGLGDVDIIQNNHKVSVTSGLNKAKLNVLIANIDI